MALRRMFITVSLSSSSSSSSCCFATSCSSSTSFSIITSATTTEWNRTGRGARTSHRGMEWIRHKNTIVSPSPFSTYSSSNSTSASSSSSSASSSSADFGFKDVPKEEKQNMVREVFSKVAENYDVMNDVMSMGAHRLWKDELVSMLGLRALSRNITTLPLRFLDVAGGTGDVGFRIAKEVQLRFFSFDSTREEDENRADEDRQVVVCDINPEMLAVGRKRAENVLGKEGKHHVGFVEGNAENLPFADNSFDYYTIAFGLRNVTNKELALKEAYRVLRKGGRLLIMEFSQVENPFLRSAYDQYSFNVIPKLGGLVANDEASYQYLVESIRRFPNQEMLLAMVSEAGFQSVSYRNFTFGVVAVHSGFKI